jgi:oligopeptide transport system permease protein
MIKFVARRAVELIIVFFGVTFLIYAAVFALPGDPISALSGGDSQPLSPTVVAQLRSQYHLDDPLWQQYLGYLGRLLQGNLGTNFHGQSVGQLLATRWPVTIQLAITAWLIEVVLGVLLGLLAGLHKDSVLDRGVLLTTIMITSIPIFVMGVATQLIFGVKLQLVPIAGTGDGYPRSYLMPAIVLAIYGLAAVARLMRGSVVDTLQTDFVRTLWAKGLPGRRVIGVHVLRNSSIPVITFLAIDLGALLGGAIVIEGIFNLPGVGQLLFQSIRTHEGPTVVGIATALIIIFLVTSVLVDVINGLLDPRIRHA